MSSNKPCAETALGVDNTPIPCDEFISTECVIHPDALLELGLPADSDARAIFNAILNSLINLNNQIGVIEAGEGVEVLDNGVVVLNDTLKINFTTNLTATQDGVDLDQVNVEADLPDYTLNITAGNQLEILRDAIVVSTVDLTPYLDNTNLARIVSGAIVGTDLVLTRDDATFFNIDISSLIIDVSNFVTLNTSQTITAQKAWSATQTFNFIADFRSGFPFFERMDLYPHTPPAPISTSNGIMGTNLSDQFYLRARNNTNYVNIDVSGVTADRVITMPDKDLTWGLDDDAIHVNVANEISGIATKALPVAGDLIVIEDSADGFNKKSVDIGTLPGGGGGVASVNSGSYINVDNTDPVNPIINVQSVNTAPSLAIGTTFNDLFNTVPANVTVNFSQTGNLVHYDGFIACQRNALVAATNYTAIFTLTLPIPSVSARAIGNVFVDALTLQPAIQQHCDASTPNTLTITIRVYNAVAQGTGSATIFFTGTYRAN